MNNVIEGSKKVVGTSVADATSKEELTRVKHEVLSILQRAGSSVLPLIFLVGGTLIAYYDWKRSVGSNKYHFLKRLAEHETVNARKVLIVANKFSDHILSISNRDDSFSLITFKELLFKNIEVQSLIDWAPSPEPKPLFHSSGFPRGSLGHVLRALTRGDHS